MCLHYNNEKYGEIRNLPWVLAVGLELVFGPPNPRREGLIVGNLGVCSFIVSCSLTVSVVFGFCIVADESVVSRSVKWWLWLSHLKCFERKFTKKE